MKTNFIIPSWSYWKEPTRAQPLTQMYLATILEEEGVDVEITDLRDGPKEISKADIFFYTVASPDLKEVQGIVKDLREQYPDAKHIAGGPHPSIFPGTEGFDSIVAGRGEEAIKKIVREYPKIFDLYSDFRDKRPYSFPKRHFLPIEKIVQEGLFKTDDIRSTTAQFSFGCPFGCSFCANYNKGTVKRNSLEQISDEIDYLKDTYKIEGLSLQDEIAIPLNSGEAVNFLNMIKSKDIKWRGQIRALRDTSILELARDSGLVELSFGLESVNQDVLRMANKRIAISDVEKTLLACKDYGIKTRLYLLNGLPGEKEGIVKETKEFIDRTKPDLVLLSSFQPYPGCPIERNPQKYGIEWISTDYDKFNHLKGRFEDSEDDLTPQYKFYEGQGLTGEQITKNLIDLQEFLREKGMNK